MALAVDAVEGFGAVESDKERMGAWEGEGGGGAGWGLGMQS